MGRTWVCFFWNGEDIKRLPPLPVVEIMSRGCTDEVVRKLPKMFLDMWGVFMDLQHSNSSPHVRALMGLFAKGAEQKTVFTTKDVCSLCSSQPPCTNSNNAATAPFFIPSNHSCLKPPGRWNGFDSIHLSAIRTMTFSLHKRSLEVSLSLKRLALGD